MHNARERRRAELRAGRFHDGAATAADVPKIACQVEVQVASRRSTHLGASLKLPEPRKRQGRQKPANRVVGPRLPLLGSASTCRANPPSADRLRSIHLPMPPARSAARSSLPAGVEATGVEPPKQLGLPGLPVAREQELARGRRRRRLAIRGKGRRCWRPGLEENLSISLANRKFAAIHAELARGGDSRRQRSLPDRRLREHGSKRTRDDRLGGTERKIRRDTNLDNVARMSADTIRQRVQRDLGDPSITFSKRRFAGRKNQIGSLGDESDGHLSCRTSLIADAGPVAHSGRRSGEEIGELLDRVKGAGRLQVSCDSTTFRGLPRQSSARPSGSSSSCPASITSVVDAPRLVSSDASPTRPECAVTRPRDTGGQRRPP